MKTSSEIFDADYFERGEESGKSLYSNYRWLPELTIPFCAAICEQVGIARHQSVLDFGCAKGYLVKALRMLGREAYGCDISDYARASADADTKRYLRPAPGDFDRTFDWIIAKDVLEHIAESDLPATLDTLRTLGGGLFVVVPLARDGTYVIPQMEEDCTHIIRWDAEQWAAAIRAAGWQVKWYTDDMDGMKQRWADWPGGHGFFICR